MLTGTVRTGNAGPDVELLRPPPAGEELYGAAVSGIACAATTLDAFGENAPGERVQCFTTFNPAAVKADSFINVEGKFDVPPYDTIGPP